MYAFNIVRIWEIPAAELMAFPGLPFVGLSKSADPVQALRQSVREILKLADESQQHEAMAAAYVLAGLRFEEAVIA